MRRNSALSSDVSFCFGFELLRFEAFCRAVCDFCRGLENPPAREDTLIIVKVAIPLHSVAWNHACFIDFYSRLRRAAEAWGQHLRERYSHGKSGGDHGRYHRGKPGDDHRAGSVRLAAVAELPAVVIAPTPHRAVVAANAGMRATR